MRGYCIVVAVLLSASCTESVGVGPGPAPAPAASPDTGQSAIARFLNAPTDPGNWRWLCKAAADGNSAAQYTIAVRYRDGLPPVARNVGRSYRWFTAAVRSGLSAAAVARDDLQKSIPDADLKALRDDKRSLTEADCAKNRG